MTPTNGANGLRPQTPQERAAVFGLLVGWGVELTAQQWAELLGLSASRARAFMNELSRVLPICPLYVDEDGSGVWGCVGEIEEALQQCKLLARLLTEARRLENA